MRKIMIKATCLVVLFIFTSTFVDAQSRINRPVQSTKDADEEKWTDRLVMGGGLGVSFYNGWIINASPVLGYRITDDLWAGVGLEYYFGQIRFNSSNKFNTRVLGPKAWVLYYVFPQFNLGTEYISNDVKRTDVTNNIKTFERDVFDSWLVGAGYTEWFGPRGGIRIELYYDVLYDESNPNWRNRPFFPRINVFFGI